MAAIRLSKENARSLNSLRKRIAGDLSLAQAANAAISTGLLHYAVNPFHEARKVISESFKGKGPAYWACESAIIKHLPDIISAQGKREVAEQIIKSIFEEGL